MLELSPTEYEVATVARLQEFVIEIMKSQVQPLPAAGVEVDIFANRTAAVIGRQELAHTARLIDVGIVCETTVFASIRGLRGLRGGALDFVQAAGSLHGIPLKKLRFFTVARNLNQRRGSRLARIFAHAATPFSSQSYPLTVMPIWLPEGQAWPQFEGEDVTDQDVLDIKNWDFQGPTAALQRHIFNFCLAHKYDHARDAEGVLVWLTHGGNHRLFARLNPVNNKGVRASENPEELVFANVICPKPLSELIVTATRASHASRIPWLFFCFQHCVLILVL